ncbi:MAG: hypothetical protein LIP09_05440 [Bacteroidales bacterium]|nr:hypothetical protein [Bacteroidales bacterium]
MAEFDPTKVNTYSIMELANMIEANEVSLEEIYGAGYAAPKRPDLKKELERRKKRT